VNTNIEIIPNIKECYAPLVDFESWRVAGLNHCDLVDIANLTRVERHLETDEVFLLTAGRAALIVERGGENETGAARGNPFEVIPMKPNTLYNIKKGIFHHVVMEKDASIILVENSDTAVENSEYKDLTADEVRAIQDAVKAAGTNPSEG